MELRFRTPYRYDQHPQIQALMRHVHLVAAFRRVFKPCFNPVVLHASVPIGICLDHRLIVLMGAGGAGSAF